MKKIKFLLPFFLCLTESAFAGIYIGNPEGKIAYNGKGTVVAITPSGEKDPTDPNGKRINPEYVLHYSQDYGQTWHRMAESGRNPSDPTCVKWQNPKGDKPVDSLVTVRYLGNKFYAVGSNMRICSSNTGVDGWKQTPANLIFGDTLQNLSDIVVGGSSWIAVGMGGAIYRSEDPEKMGWCNNDGSNPKDRMKWCAKFSNKDDDFTRVVYGNNPKKGSKFVAIAPGDPTIWYSVDGREWLKANLSGKDQNGKVRKGWVSPTGAFANLHYVADKNKFVVVDWYMDNNSGKSQPIVFSSDDGINWDQGLGIKEYQSYFNDIVYAHDTDTFVAAGSLSISDNSFDNIYVTNTEQSKTTSQWTLVDSQTKNLTIGSLIYSAKEKHIIGTTFNSYFDSNSVAHFIPTGFGTFSPEGNWVQARMHYTGGCASQQTNPGQLSKPIIVIDPMGNEHYIVTPSLPGGCAYWSTDANDWYASSYNDWK